MKNNIILYITLLSTLIFSSEYEKFKLKNSVDNSYNVEFNLNEVVLEDRGEYNKIKIDSKTGTTGIIGMPKLPAYSSLVMVDPTKNYRLEYIVNSSYIINDIKIIPNQRLENGLEKQVLDDIDLNLGTLRFKLGGGTGGHKGIESIIYQLESEDFQRLKLGIALEDINMKPSEKYVLTPFPKK